MPEPEQECESGDWRLTPVGLGSKRVSRAHPFHPRSIVISDSPNPRNPLFLLSFRQRDELSAAAARGGWSPIAARRFDLAERRFVLSGATIAVVDARGAFEEGLEAVARLADPVEANAAALITLVSKKDVARVGEMLAAGATHFLGSPFGEAEFLQLLRFAARYTARLGHSFADNGRPTGPIGPQWRWDRATDRVEIDPELARLIGFAEAEPIALDGFFAALGEEADTEARAALKRLAETGSPTAFAHKLDEDGRLIHHISGDGTSVIGQVEQPDRAVEPKARGRRDPLTGLGDAHLARQWIEQRLGEPRNGGPRLVLLLIGLQRFDRINSTLGRVAGDEALRGIARRIESLVGPMAGRKRLIARLAGAEFLIGLSPPTDLEEAELLARRLAKAIEQPFAVQDQPIAVKIRGGIVVDQADDEGAAGILRRASAALAEARSEDGEAIRVFGNDAERAASHANRLEIDLVAALGNGEIDIVYQPQLEIGSGSITGVEALARWRHPELGMLGADVLLAAADRADRLVELSAHIQAKALAIAAGWDDARADLRVAINVTAAEMAEADFCAALLARIAESGFPPERLTVEITESGLIGDLATAAEQLARLREAGLRVAIDDFGTGYSSLAYLKTLPLDYLKLDRRLSQDIAGGPRDRVVVSGVIEMARSLGLQVVAEGVETGDQLALLTEEGCDLCQGYLCAPPLTEDDLSAFLEERSG